MAVKNEPTYGALEGGNVESDDESLSRLASLLDGGDNERNSIDDSPASDDDAPPEKAASGEDKVRDEPEETPAIEAPASWDAEAKKRFAKLDADTQAFIVAREADREKGVNSKLQEVSEARKKADAAFEQVEKIRTAYEQRLVAHARQLEAEIPDEFKAIKSAADLYRLAEKDPALVARFTAFQQRAAAVMGEIAQIQQQRAEEASTRHREFLAKESEALAKVWPEFVDQTKGPAIRSEMTSYAKERGFSDAEISGLADHRLVMVLKDAIEGRKAVQALEKARAKADKAPAARVAKPGQGEASRGNGLDRNSLMAAARSGNTDRQVAALARLLEG